MDSAIAEVMASNPPPPLKNSSDSIYTLSNTNHTGYCSAMCVMILPNASGAQNGAND